MLDFTEIYYEHVDRVYGFIGYRVSSRPEAEDLTQQTFERALRHLSKFDSKRGSVETWLLSIARNLVIDHYRGPEQCAGTTQIEDLPGQMLHTAVEPEASLGISADLAVALSDLTDRERELIALRFGGDLTGPEIARLTGLTLGNVHQVMSRALRKLREALYGSVGAGPAVGRATGATPPDLDIDRPVG